MNTVSKMVNHFNRRLFRKVTKNRLVYNACWEDPRIDRQLLKLHSESSVLMITSAGCNALDYLLDDPASVDCVDINPAQNALLAFKKALFKLGDYETLWQLFGLGAAKNINQKYQHHIRHLLPPEFRTYWDANIEYFSTESPSFYYHGTAGLVAKLVVRYLHRKGLKDDIAHLLQSQTLAEQQYYFEEIKPYLSTSFTRFLLNNNTVLSCLGVPKPQRELIIKQDDGIQNFVLSAIEHVFTQIPVKDNYFWHVYLKGSYSKSCCPNYLKEESFRKLKHRINRIDVHNDSLCDYLKKCSGTYSHFVLLDHQDWLADANHTKLLKKWKLILQKAEPGTRVLFRSAATERHFIPEFIRNHVSFKDKETQRLHAQDRVGTYGSTHLAVVHTPL